MYPQQFGMQGPGYNMPPAVPGNLFLGLLAGFFGSCIGLVLVLIIAKGPATKKGAIIGFVAQFVLGVVFNIIARA